MADCPDLDHHICDVPQPPVSLDETWTCPVCSKQFRAFDVLEEFDKHPAFSPEQMARFRKHLKPGTLGWTTRERNNSE